MREAVIAMIKEKGHEIFKLYGLEPMDVEQPEGDAVIVPFGNLHGAVHVCLSGREVRMNADPEQMEALVDHRLNNAYRTFQTNGGLR